MIRRGNCKAYPDEKGIETLRPCHLPLIYIDPDCKAYPDEKGIETSSASLHSHGCLRYCKAYPDEKGIETVASRWQRGNRLLYCKAYPDEKGIETWLARERRLQTNPIILTASQVKTEFRVIVRINQF